MRQSTRIVLLAAPALLVLVAVSKLVVFAALTPMWQAPDEAAHSSALATWLFGQLDDSRSSTGRQPLIFEQAYDWGSHSLDLLELKGNVGRGGGRPTFTSSRYGLREAPLHDPIPLDGSMVNTSSSTLSYPQLYYWLTAALTRAILPQSSRSFLNLLFTARLTGVPWVVAGTLALHYLALKLTQARPLALLVALGYLCNGLFTYLTAVLNPDGPLFAVFIIGAGLCAALWIDGRLPWWKWALLAGLSAAAPLIKPNGLFFAGCWVGAFGVAITWRDGLTLRNKPLLMMLAIVAAAATVHIAHTAYKGQPVLHGTPDTMSFLQYLRAIYHPSGPYMVMNLIGQYGWLELDHPAWLYGLQYVFLLGGTLLFVLRRPTWNGGLTGGRRSAVLLLLASFLLTIAGAFVYQYFFLLPKVGFAMQGRYFGYGFFVLYLAATLGLAYSLGGRASKVLLALWVSLQAIVPIDGVRLTVQRFYAPQDWHELIQRASQYKPPWLKGDALAAVILVGGFCLLVAWRVGIYLIARLPAAPPIRPG
jgi:hypothetical protein